MKINIDLMDWQVEHLNSTATVKALCGASDTGKSWVSRLSQVLTALKYPKSHHFASANTYTQTYRAIIEPLIQFLRDHEIDHLAELKKGEGLIEFKNKSRIEMFSADKMFDRLRSREFSTGFLEEISTIPDKDFEKIYYESLRRLRQPGMPHHLYLATNPDMETRWFSQNIFLSPPEDAFVKMLCFKEGYNRNNAEREAKILMGSKRQIDIFYYGKMARLEGQAFPLEPERHIRSINTADLDKYYISFDYGFHPNPMIYLLCSVRNGIIFIVDEIVLDSIPVSRHHDYLDKWTKEFNIMGYTGETATGSGEIRSLLNSYKIPYYATVKNRKNGWTAMADWIDQDRFVIDSKCKKTIHSMTSMVWVGSTQGVDCEATAMVENTDPNQRPSPFDDPADAVRYFGMCPLIFNQMNYKSRGGVHIG